MLNNLKILALIPARGGSKEIKDKNITLLHNSPLISYSITAALDSKYIDDVVVTTDSERIAQVAVLYGAEVPFMRPKELAGDHSTTLDAVIHAIETLKEIGRTYDVLMLLQPTQPLRTAKDIDLSLERFIEQGRRALVSVSKVSDHPLLIRSIDEEGKLIKMLNVSSTCRRQDMPEYYRVNGCIYINNIGEIDKDTSFNDNPIPFIMPRSHSVDIDEPSDLYMAEYYLSFKRNEND